MDQSQEIARLYQLLGQVVRVGTVTSINATDCSARVQFKDRNGVVSYDLRVLVKNTLNQKDYWMPEVYEQVLCLFLPNGIEQGYILGSFFSRVTTPLADSEKIRKVTFDDGTAIEYDRDTNKLQIDISESAGQVVINCAGSVTVNGPKIDLGESSDLEPSVLGDKLAAWISSELKPWLDSHQHIGNLGAPTSAASAAPFGPFVEGTGASGGAVYSTKNRNQ